MKTPILLAITIVFVIQINAFSQKEFKRGYIVKANGDSLAGFVAFRNRNGNGNSCYFREADKSQAILLSPLDIKVFGYLLGERFDSKKLPVINGQVFVKTWVKGKMSLYQYHDLFYVETDKLYPLEEKKSSNDKTGQYIAVLNGLLAECNLKANNAKYIVKDITNLVQNYNRCKGGPGIKYEEERKTKPTVNLYGYFGTDVSSLKIDGFNSDSFNQSNAIIFGVGIHASFVPTLPKLFFNVETSYVKHNYNGYSEKKISSTSIQRDEYLIDASFIRVPTGVGYSFRKKANTPYLKCGTVLFYRLKTSENFVSERDSQGTVTTDAGKLNYPERNPVGYWIAAGFNLQVFRPYKLFVEVRYEKTNGFIGAAHSLSDSSTKNISAVIGIRF